VGPFETSVRIFHSSNEIRGKKKMFKCFPLRASRCGCSVFLQIKRKGCDLAGYEAELVIMHLVVKKYGNTTHHCSIYARGPFQSPWPNNTRSEHAHQNDVTETSYGAQLPQLPPRKCVNAFKAHCNIKNVYILPTEFICLFCTSRRTHYDYFCIQH